MSAGVDRALNLFSSMPAKCTAETVFTAFEGSRTGDGDLGIPDGLLIQSFSSVRTSKNGSKTTMAKATCCCCSKTTSRRIASYRIEIHGTINIALMRHVDFGLRAAAALGIHILLTTRIVASLRHRSQQANVSRKKKRRRCSSNRQMLLYISIGFPCFL